MFRGKWAHDMWQNLMAAIHSYILHHGQMISVDSREGVFIDCSCERKFHYK